MGPFASLSAKKVSKPFPNIEKLIVPSLKDRFVQYLSILDFQMRVEHQKHLIFGIFSDDHLSIKDSVILMGAENGDVLMIDSLCRNIEQQSSRVGERVMTLSPLQKTQQVHLSILAAHYSMAHS